MNLSPEALTAILIGTPAGSAFITWFINRNMTNLSSIPELRSSLKNFNHKLDEISHKFTELRAEIKADIKHLSDKKDKNWESIIKLNSSVEAQWRDVDDLKKTSKELELKLASGTCKK